ncbi:MAG: nicotinate (nicotinamide) nucleotide adenylyltransferase [Bacteroidia bacterium]|jgi:nicotinate-nucleotide adenylyltransferase|nr:nicotinate (nicotinamide) nucleotide adenylyltransferase [Bacteroidia bacterium]
MKVGLFFGSFNPIHVGHLVLANYMLSFTDLDKLWFVVSPHNPLKEKKTLLADHHRLELVSRAIGDHPNLKASDIEFKLPQPSFTVNTLAWLADKYPQYQFALIMGSDNLNSLKKWKNYEVILEHYQIYVYPRPGFDGGDLRNHASVKFTDAPVMEISSTFIREAIRDKKDVRYFMPVAAWEYLDEMNFYRK